MGSSGDPSIVGILALAEAELDAATAELAAAQARARATAEPLAKVMEQLLSKRRALVSHRNAIRLLGQEVLACNQKAIECEREREALEVRLQEVLAALASASEEAQRMLRRKRNRLRGEIEERKDIFENMRAQARATRDKLAKEEAVLHGETALEAGVLAELDSWQAKLVPPELFFSQFELALGVAHARYRLNGDAKSWREAVLAALEAFVPMLEALVGGAYRLDQHSGFRLGRPMVVGDALALSVALGADALGLRIARSALDASSLFCDIFSVFRAWVWASLILDAQEMQEQLYTEYRYFSGAHGAWAEMLWACRSGDWPRMGWMLPAVQKNHARLWCAAHGSKRALGLICADGLGFARLAQNGGHRGLQSHKALPLALL